jgi:hypothetical protein
MSQDFVEYTINNKRIDATNYLQIFVLLKEYGKLLKLYIDKHIIINYIKNYLNNLIK